jgi:autotransporter-associated beta strand protein
MKKTTKLLSALLAGTFLSFALQQSAQAQTTLSYTNTTADAWLTPTSWTPANDWTSGAVKTNATTANVRLNIGTVANQPVSVTYDATMGTTILNNSNTSTIGMLIGSGNSTTGAVIITGGTLVIRNGNPSLGGVGVGGPAGGGPGQGTLTLSGGNLVFTNANGNGFGFMTVPLRGGSTNGGANFASGTININSGSTATLERTFFGFNQGEAGAQCTGIINLNAGGTLSTRNIRARDGDTNVNTSQMAAFLNLNGGTLRVLGANVADANAAFVSEVANSTNFTVNVQSGGAIVDTAGFNATINKGLLDAGGGGGFTKNGLGTLTLTQTNTYTGATVVNGGNLTFNYPVNSSGLTIADGAAVSITTKDISWTNSVTSVTNATINLALGAVTANPSATTAVINTGTLNASGTNVINITSGSGLPNGKVKLIDYTSSANRSGGGSFVLGTLAPGIQATLVDGPNDVSLNVTLSVQSLIWTASASSDWQTNGLANWNGGAGTYLEYPSGVGDVANFTDAAGVFYTVNLTSDVKPALANVNITNAAVTFAGAGRIVGTNGLTKAGIGILSLANTNTYDGVTSVENGTLAPLNTFALGSSVGETVVGSAGVLAISGGLTVSGETARISGPGFGGSRGTLRGADASDNVWAGPIVLGSADARIGTEDGGKLIISGPITDNGNTNTLLYRPGTGGTIVISNSAHNYFRTATFSAVNSFVILGVANAFSTNVLQVGPGNIDLNGLNHTVGGLETFFGPGVVLNNGGSTSTLTINTGTSNYTGTAIIQDGAAQINLVKLGSGRQTLTTPTNGAPSTYTGTTVVSEGDLRVDGVLGNTPITVASGAVLSGNGGSINGTISVNSGATFAPGGDSIGVLTNNNTLTLSAGSTSLFKLNAATITNDSVVVTTVVYGGTLSVTNFGATPIQVGQVYKLFAAGSFSGNFVNAAGVAIPGGSTGTFNPATGELTITAVPPAPTLNVVQSGNSLQFSWDNLNGIYRLQAQTNALNVGISTNWFNYPGGTTNSLTVPIDAANESVFYRLVAP